MIKKHPQDRAERMAINEKKKKDKRHGSEGFSNKPSRTIPSDIIEERKDN